MWPLSARLRTLLPPGAFGRGIALLVSGTVLGQTIVLLAAPLLTRLYTPADFGVLGVFAALLGLFGLAVCLRYEVAIPLAEDDRQMANLLAVAVLAALLVSAVLGLALWLVAGPLLAALDARALGPWLWLLPVGLFALGCYVAFNHWAIRRRAFGRIMRTRLSQSIGQVVVQIGVGLAVAGPAGLLLGQVLGQSTGLSSLAAAFARQEWPVLRAIRPRAMAAAAHRFGRFAGYGAPGALLNGGSRLLPALLIAALYGAEITGFFVLAQRILGTPMKLLGSAVAQVYLSEAPRLAREAPAAMYVLFRRTAANLLAVGVVVLGTVVLAGPTLFGIVFGASWTETGLLARFLALIYLAQLVVGPITNTLLVLERQDVLLVSEALRFLAMLAVFLAAHQLAWPPLLTIAVFSATMATSYLLLFILMRRLLLARHAVG